MTAPPQLANDKLAYSIAGSAAALDVSERTIWNLISAGKVRTVRLGRRRLIPAGDIRAIAEGRESEIPHAA